MIEWLLAGMAADLVFTSHKKHNEVKVQNEIKQIRSRLKIAVTRGHTRQCKCQLCQNRRQSLKDKLAALM
jgi:hypothetical protein